MYNASYRYDIWKYSTFKNTYHFFRLWKYLFLHIQIVCKLENNEYFLHTISFVRKRVVWCYLSFFLKREREREYYALAYTPLLQTLIIIIMHSNRVYNPQASDLYHSIELQRKKIIKNTLGMIHDDNYF